MELGRKIRELRERAGLTQKELGKLMYCDSSRISRIENGDMIPGDKLIADTKASLNIVGLPFTEREVADHRERLEEWKEFIRLRCFDEADKLWSRIEPVTEVPCEDEVNLRQSLYTVRYFLLHERLDDARELLSRINPDDASAEVLYEYHYVAAMMLIYDGKDYDALRHMRLAEKVLPKVAANDEGFNGNIARCYWALEMPMHALVYANSAWELEKFKGEDENSDAYLGEIADCYMQLRLYSKAEVLFKRCLRLANTRQEIVDRAVATHNLGDLYMREGEYDKAIEYFDKVFEYCEEGSGRYSNNLLFKTYALFQAERNEEAENSLEKGIRLTDASTVTGIYFRALKHSLNLSDDKSRSYMEKVAIPKLIALGKKLKVIEYCEQLEDFYVKHKSPRRAEKYIRLQRDLYRRVMFEEDLSNEEKVGDSFTGRYVFSGGVKRKRNSERPEAPA